MFNPTKVAREAVTAHGAIQKPGELAGLLALLVDRAPEVVLEIGSDHGGTLWAWQQLPSVRRVLAVDLPLGGFHSGRRLDTHGVEAVYGDSHKPETLGCLHELLGVGYDESYNATPRVDFLFIDGDHTFDGVKADYEMYSPLVRPGGIVAFHDILTHPNMPYVAVDILWRQLGGVKDEIVTDPQTWGGIGVLHVAADVAVAR